MRDKNQLVLRNRPAGQEQSTVAVLPAYEAVRYGVRSGHAAIFASTGVERRDMTGDQPEDSEGRALLAFLDAQREAVLSIVAGL
jgi:hypothetical protein